MFPSRSTLFAVTIITCSSLSLSTPARGQILGASDVTTTPVQGVGHNYIRELTETVNPANGSLSLRLGVPMPGGRGLSLPFSFAYDSNGTHHVMGITTNTALWRTNLGLLSHGGWSFSIPMASRANWTVLNSTIPSVCAYSSSYVFADATGSRHSLYVGAINDQEAQTDASCIANAFPQSGDNQVEGKLTGCLNCPQTTYPDFTVSDTDGTIYSFPTANFYEAGPFDNVVYQGFPSYIEDRNGNKVTGVVGSNPANFTFTDTLGRTLISSSGNRR